MHNYTEGFGQIYFCVNQFIASLTVAMETTETKKIITSLLNLLKQEKRKVFWAGEKLQIVLLINKFNNKNSGQYTERKLIQVS